MFRDEMEVSKIGLPWFQGMLHLKSSNFDTPLYAVASQLVGMLGNNKNIDDNLRIVL